MKINLGWRDSTEDGKMEAGVRTDNKFRMERQ